MFLVAGRVTRSAAFVAQPRRGFRAVADWGPNAGGGVRTAPSLPWSSPPALLSTATPQEEITPAVVSTKVATEEEEIRLPTNEDSEELLKIRHTTAHVMAMAVQEGSRSLVYRGGSSPDTTFSSFSLAELVGGRGAQQHTQL